MDLKYDLKGKKYIFAMNGQTGKIVGDLPGRQWSILEIYCHVGSRDRTCPLCTALGFHGVAVRRWRDEENKNENHVSAA